MKAVFLDYATLDQQDLDHSELAQQFSAFALYPSTQPEEVLTRIQHADVVISNKVVLDAGLIKQCSQLKLILISATGTNNVDLEQARAQGIVVANCQGYGTSAVAQHTLALMLALATSLPQYQARIRQGAWSQSSQFCLLDFPIVELAGKTLGIVGYGTLGQAVARLARAFDMQVIVAALPHRSAHAQQDERVPFEDFLAQVDFLSLHCPLTTGTKDLIDAKALSRMKSSAFLINCARGGIVNEADLATALRQGQIAGAALDVLSVEPPPADHVLLAHDIPNLILTPHSAWGSVDARQRILDQVLENAKAFQAGQALRVVNG